MTEEQLMQLLDIDMSRTEMYHLLFKLTYNKDGDDIARDMAFRNDEALNEHVVSLIVSRLSTMTKGA